MKIFRASERPDLRQQAERLGAAAWPVFLTQGAACVACWHRLYDGALAAFQAYAVEELDGRETLIASSNAVPFHWAEPGAAGSLPDEGWDAVLTEGVQAPEAGRAVNALSALAVVVAPEWRRGPVAEAMLRDMKAVAKAHGLDALVAPVRPTRKQDHPLLSFEAYCSRTTVEGAPFDPWVRKHWRLGATIARIAPRSMTVEGTLDAWRRWTGLDFREDGAHQVPGGLVPVVIDRAANRGLYVEPNLWMIHPLG